MASDGMFGLSHEETGKLLGTLGVTSVTVLCAGACVAIGLLAKHGMDTNRAIELAKVEVMRLEVLDRQAQRDHEIRMMEARDGE